MRTKLGIQPINIKTNVHLLRQPVYNFIDNLLPCLSFILPAFNIPVKVSNHPVVAVADELQFITAVVSNADLQKSLQIGNFFQGIEHNAGVGVCKVAVALSQIAMRIDLQNAKIPMFFRNGFEIAQWCTVIPTKQSN